uniref:Uncharacterized protein n=1 Tax=Magallana gigas TaxID=29159 RepID=K1QY54_MAGGI
MNTIVFVFLAFSCACLADNIGFRYGGLGDLMDATSKTQHLVDSVRDDIIDELPLGYDREQPLQLKAVSYRKQLVSGYNYYIKIWSHNCNDEWKQIFKTR